MPGKRPSVVRRFMRAPLVIAEHEAPDLRLRLDIGDRSRDRFELRLHIGEDRRIELPR